jgi:hypothetical protein
MGLGFLPQVAIASTSCMLNASGPCTPDDKLKNEIKEAIAQGREAEERMRSAWDNRKKAADNGDEDGMYDAIVEAHEYQRDMEEGFSKAMRLIVEYYHISPPAMAGQVVGIRDPSERGKWAQGMEVEWSPEFVSDTSEHVRVVGADGAPHYLGGEINLRLSGGRTYVSGKTSIYRQAIEEVWISGNPGMLASIMHHEARHFSELIGRGWDSLEKGEVRTYRESIAAADIFELNDAAKDKLKDHLKQYSQVLSRGKENSLFPSPEQELRNEIEFEKALNKRKEFDRQFAELKERVEARRAERENATRWEKLQARRQEIQECYSRSCPGRDLRQELWDVYSEINGDGLAKLVEEAKRCGFELGRLQQYPGVSGQWQYSFYRGPDQYSFVLVEPDSGLINVDLAKAHFMLTKYCSEVGGYEDARNGISACNDSLSTIQRYWKSEDFRTTLLWMQGDGLRGEYYSCAEAILSLKRPPAGIADIDRAIRAGQAGARARREEFERRNSSNPRESPRGGGRSDDRDGRSPTPTRPRGVWHFEDYPSQ